jgi:CheY-like chemotaxis protein
MRRKALFTLRHVRLRCHSFAEEWLMARILSISYDTTLLQTRELLLTGKGHNVVSALGFQRGAEACQGSGFDLFILGHSIPQEDKLDLIRRFRETNPAVPVIALTHPHESPLKEVDRYLDPGDPAELLRSLAFLIDPATERRRVVAQSTPIALVRTKSP